MLEHVAHSVINGAFFPDLNTSFARGDRLAFENNCLFVAIAGADIHEYFSRPETYHNVDIWTFDPFYSKYPVVSIVISRQSSLI